MFGFKSFPEKTSLTFEPGITAIVGPNGCGKTNVSDAIRWVLGEQSAMALRGSRMEDIIFNGSANRKPLGLAEVSLTLSNPENFLPLEYSEVTVTRRVSRSGESEYFINRTPCRLRDINELFMDTGIGMQAYSLIEQGKVDLILSSKPNDRRRLFEEAAGITKYKERKRTALRKLDATEQNLMRVSDIVGEVKRQIGSLKRQVRKAERYQENFDKLKEMEIKLALANMSKFKKEETLHSGELKSASDKREELSAHISEGDGFLETLRVSLLDSEKVLAEKQENSKDLTIKINHHESQILLLRERRESLSRDGKRVKGEQENLAGKISRLQEEIKENEVKVSQLSKGKNDREAKVKESEQALRDISRVVEEEEKKIEENKSMVVETLSREANVKNDMAGLKVNMENLSARKRRLRLETEQETGEKEKIETREKELKEALKEKSNALNETIDSLEKLRLQIASIDSQLNVLKEELNVSKDELAGSSSRLNFLQDLKRKYEGYDAGVKAVLQSRAEKFPEVCGTVADLIDCPTELEAALESALGENVQNVVVKTMKTAGDSISYLRGEDKGRATFLPLDSIKVADDTGVDFGQQEGVVGIASELVNYDPVYKKVFSCLLGKTVIVEDLQTAERLFRSNSYAGINLVTLKGEFISREGTITGGSKTKGEGLLRRDREIKELREKIESIQNSISKIESEEKIKTEEVRELSSELEILDEKKHRQEVEKAGLENEDASVEEDVVRKRREVALLQNELKEVEDDEVQAKQEQERLSKELEELGRSNEQAREVILSLQQSIEENKQNKDVISHELTRLQVELASWEEKEGNENNHLTRLKDAFREHEEGQRHCLAELEEADRRRVEIDTEEESNETALKGFFEERDSLETELKNYHEERQNILAGVKEKETELKDKRTSLEEILNKIHDLDLQTAQLGMNVNSLRERLSSEYHLSLDDLFLESEEKEDKDSEEDFDEETVTREVAELKTKLESIGPVNLVAIEENKELEERYNFLVEQQEDLIQAKESLQKVITKINRTTRSLFAETFEEVRKHFNGLFRTLFGGGKSDLFLIDESEILESGIEIIAQPPGKKLQSISLLSGGERALTAVALLFALFKVKPSPFCLLDEIDAPLDESNITRFTKLLHEFTSQTQFIIITHNKRTISMANVMYGVTMEESGVSKLISVRFSKGDKEQSQPESGLAKS